MAIKKVPLKQYVTNMNKHFIAEIEAFEEDGNDVRLHGIRLAMLMMNKFVEDYK